MDKIRQHWIWVIPFLALGFAIWQSKILCVADYTNFCNGFLGNLLSDVIVAISFGFIFIKYFESRNHPDIFLVVNGDRNFTMSKTSATNDGFVLKFGVLNKNRKALKQDDGTYHILINKELSPELRTGTTGRESFSQNVHNYPDYIEVTDVNPGPVLQNSIIEMVDIAGKLHQDVSESIIYYFINTESGVFPKGARFNKTPGENLKTWGKVKISFT